MARRKTATRTRIVRVGAPRAASPIIRIAAPRAAVTKHRRRSGRRGRRSSVGGFVSQHNLDLAIGGAVYGFAVKSGYIAMLPAIPILGRTGTAALLLDYLSKRGGGELMARAAGAAAVLAGYQLGSEGQITGGDSYAEGDYSEGDYSEGDDLQSAGDLQTTGEENI